MRADGQGFAGNSRESTRLGKRLTISDTLHLVCHVLTNAITAHRSHVRHLTDRWISTKDWT
jgi:hypothetical protein